MKNSTKAILTVFLGSLIWVGCAGVQPRSEERWIPVGPLRLQEAPRWEDFSLVLEDHLRVLDSQSKELRFGPYAVDSKDLARSLRWCLAEARKSAAPHQRFFELLTEHFYGVNPFQEASLVTGYYQPVYQARLKPEPPYTQPLYQKPPELLTVDLNSFQQVYSGEHHRDFPNNMRLRGWVKEGRVVPYLSRREIDQEGVLKGRDLEIAYVDPIDAFFLQIQGSGKLTLKNQSTFWVGFADQNGHPYLALGRRLRDHLSANQMGMEALQKHMRSLDSVELAKLLNENPSYIFFEKRIQQATGSLGLVPRAGRTVAVDPSVFSLGGIGFLEFGPEAGQPSRLVFFQDTGGAIKGSRLDLFMGEGHEAGKVAGEIREKAHMIVLLPSANLLSRLEEAGPSSKR